MNPKPAEFMSIPTTIRHHFGQSYIFQNSFVSHQNYTHNASIWRGLFFKTEKMAGMMSNDVAISAASFRNSFLDKMNDG